MRSIEIPQPEDRDWRYRAFEILPGALTWIVLALPVVVGFISAQAAAFFIIAYLLLWFVRTIALATRSIQGWKVVNQHRRLNWEALNRDLEMLQPKTPHAPKWHARNIGRVRQYIPEQSRIRPSEVLHAVFIAFWNESREVLEPTLKSVLEADYDPKKIILILAYEQRGGPAVAKTANDLIKEYGNQFYHAVAIMHPWPIIGEVIGKGGNITYAARQFEKFVGKQKIDPLRVLVTTLDADNRPDKKFFGALTYTYCSTEDPKYASYQPVTMYTNNIWDAPAPMRVIAAGNSFWNVVLSQRPHMLRNFSAHAQPMAALIDTDFWSVRTIVEDGHQYWRTWFRYDGKHEVYPIYTPIYQDAVFTEKYSKTLKMQFIQLRRWAWGASDIAYVANQGFLKKNQIPKYKVIAKFWRLIEGHVNWSTAPPLLLFGAFAPFFLHPQTFIGNELPQYASALQRIATVGLLITVYITFKSLPPRPERYNHRRTIWMVLQWVYFLVTGLVYNSFAAIYSQTRLMFGWYLGFVITEKAVKTREGDIIVGAKGVRLRSATMLSGLTAKVLRRPRQ